MKICSECGEEKELDQFHRNPSMADGHLNVCKACANAKRRADPRVHDPERRRKYREANREALNAQARARWAANPEKHKAWMREDRAKNPEKVNARQRAWRAANPEKMSAARRRNYAINKKYYTASSLLRRHGLTLEEWATLWDDQGGLCYLCRRPMSREFPSRNGAVVDHDHSCCGRNKSCRVCRRGLACSLCNVVIGCADDDPDRLRLIADSLEAVMRTLAERRLDRPAAFPVRPDEQATA